MAESDTHRDQMVDLIHCLREWFRDDPQAYVAGNLLLYYEEGDPNASVAPDVFVVKGVPCGPRPIFKVWEEGRGPDLVIEVTSKSTRLEDLGRKKALYADLGVQEYLLFDPLHDWLSPPLAGYRLEEGEWVRTETVSGRLASEVTGLEFGVVEGRLRVFDPETGAVLPTPHEEAAARRAAEAREKRLTEEVERLRRQLREQE